MTDTFLQRDLESMRESGRFFMSDRVFEFKRLVSEVMLSDDIDVGDIPAPTVDGIYIDDDGYVWSLLDGHAVLIGDITKYYGSGNEYKMSSVDKGDRLDFNYSPYIRLYLDDDSDMLEVDKEQPGLHEVFSDSKISEIFDEVYPERAAMDLIAAAFNGGGSDGFFG